MRTPKATAKENQVSPVDFARSALECDVSSHRFELVAEKSGAEAEAYFAKANGGTALEVLAGTVLRGPFGGTLVAAHPAIAARVKETLAGFAVQFVDTSRVKNANELNIEGLKAAQAFRARRGGVPGRSRTPWPRSDSRSSDRGSGA